MRINPVIEWALCGLIIAAAVSACGGDASSEAGEGGAGGTGGASGQAGQTASGGSAGQASVYSIELVAENASAPTCTSCDFYLGFSYLEDPNYGIEVMWEGKSIMWHRPECALWCGTDSQISGQPSCARPTCGRPRETVRKLAPGERISIVWDGTQVVADPSVCPPDGCLRSVPVGPGSGIVRVCAFSAFECVDEPFAFDCPNEEDGMIHGAVGSGPTHCAEAAFAFPTQSGGQAVVTLQ